MGTGGPQSLSALSSHEVDDAVTTMCSLSTGPKSSRVSQPQTQASRTVSQNNPPLLTGLPISGMCHSDGELTNRALQGRCGKSVTFKLAASLASANLSSSTPVCEGLQTALVCGNISVKLVQYTEARCITTLLGEFVPTETGEGRFLTCHSSFKTCF